MQKKIMITLPEEVQSALDDLTRKEGISLDDLVGKAVSEYLFFRRLRLLREQMIIKARAQGIQTDQDVFDRVS
jgi:metal-responsive CopG/Arc/MetJ family transcriptional regulator